MNDIDEQPLSQPPRYDGLEPVSPAEAGLLFGSEALVRWKGWGLGWGIGIDDAGVLWCVPAVSRHSTTVSAGYYWNVEHQVWVKKITDPDPRV